MGDSRCPEHILPAEEASMSRIPRFVWVGLLALFGVVAERAGAQTPSPDGNAAAAVQQAIVEAIARAEKSVVAVGRVRRERPGETVKIEPRPDPFGGRRIAALNRPRPTDPDFIFDELAAGVLIDRNGPVLTVSHVLGEESDYYVFASHRVA